jgi:hypothetical protein
MGCHVDCSGQLLRHGQCSQGDRPPVRTQGQNVRPRAANFGDDVANRIRLDAHRLAGERLFVPPVEFDLVGRGQPDVANLDRHLGGGLPQFGEAAVPAWPSRPTPWTTGSRRRRKAANGSMGSWGRSWRWESRARLPSNRHGGSWFSAALRAVPTRFRLEVMRQETTSFRTHSITNRRRRDSA